ncbi:MAG: GNAT family N-acetyltransferase [Ruminococcus sp.]
MIWFHLVKYKFIRWQKNTSSTQRYFKEFYVYEDDFVKGFIHIQGTQVLELYVDTFFVDQGIGGKLLDFAVSRNCNSLWVLEKNTKAQRFYLRHGFTPSGVRQLEEGTRTIYH